MTTSTSSTSSIPSSILTTTQYQAQQAAAQSAQSTSMGQGAFLTLFTTQLKNQDPTDPVQNSDFVAQLAQFSQLEATTSMQSSLQTLVSTMGGSSLMNAASLIGKTVGVANGPVTVSSGAVSQASVNLPTGADGLTLNIYNSSGSLVNSVTYGTQAAGQMQLLWNGTDASGNVVPDGYYTYKVSAVSNGTTSSPTVTTQSAVTSVASNSDGTTSLTVGNGQTVSLSSITNISQ
jgi:flagellar basal-body rod modification protein FlgD